MIIKDARDDALEDALEDSLEDALVGAGEDADALMPSVSLQVVNCC